MNTGNARELVGRQFTAGTRVTNCVMHVTLRPKGRELAGRLRAHKSKGGMFFNFNPAAPVAE